MAYLIPSGISDGFLNLANLRTAKMLGGSSICTRDTIAGLFDDMEYKVGVSGIYSSEQIFSYGVEFVLPH